MDMTVVFEGISDRAWPRVNVNVWITERERDGYERGDSGRQKDSERVRQKEMCCDSRFLL